MIERLDRFQQRHAWLGFPWATLQKYSDDQGGYLAATIAYYAFFSIFPLLLVLTTLLGWVLRGHPSWQHSIVDSALGQFPIIGHDLKAGSLHGNGVALVVGLLLAIWSGMGVILAAQNAMNQLWGIPFNRRPDFFRARLRALLLLLLLGGGVLAATILGALGTVGSSLGSSWKVASILLSTLLDFLLFWAAFQVLTAQKLAWRSLRNGAIAAAIAYEGLQLLGGYYVGHVVKSAENVYGTFAVVIGLLSWIYLAGHILLLTAEANVVQARRLWPRSFSLIEELAPTEGDVKALVQRGKVEERRSDEEVDVRVGEEESSP